MQVGTNNRGAWQLMWDEGCICPNLVNARHTTLCLHWFGIQQFTTWEDTSLHLLPLKSSILITVLAKVISCCDHKIAVKVHRKFGNHQVPTYGQGRLGIPRKKGKVGRWDFVDTKNVSDWICQNGRPVICLSEINRTVEVGQVKFSANHLEPKFGENFGLFLCPIRHSFGQNFGAPDRSQNGFLSVQKQLRKYRRRLAEKSWLF